MSCSQIWNIYREKNREKEKEGDRTAKLNEKKSDREPEREIKKQRRHVLLEEQHGKFVAATKVKISGSEKKVNKNTYDTSSIKHLTRTFLKVYVVIVQNNGKEMSKNVIGHFKVLCSVLWPLSRSEAGGYLVSLQTFLFFICK